MAKVKRPEVCPCCGQEVAEPVLDHIVMSHVRRKILSALPGYLEDIATAVYGARGKHRLVTLRVTIKNLRIQLEEHGYTITRGGGGAGVKHLYKLERLREASSIEHQDAF